MPGVIRHKLPMQAKPLSFADMDRQAQQIIERAKHAAARHSEQTLQAAQAEIEKRREAAFQTGLTEGRAAGLAEVRGQASKTIETAVQEERHELTLLQQALRAALAEFDDQRNRLHAHAERGLIELAAAIARRVCALHVEQNADAAAPIVARLIDSARHEADVELRVNPTQHAALVDGASSGDAAGSGVAHVHTVADESVAPGGCVLRSRDGSIDATVETQLDRIARALLGDAVSAAGPSETESA